MDRIKSLYCNVRYGVRNLIKWSPIIWRDRDWDSGFLMLMLEYKLSNMSALHRKYGNKVCSEKTANDLEYASKLARRIADEDYTKEAFGDKFYLLEKNKMEFEPFGNGNSSRLIFTGLTDEEREEMRRLRDWEHELMDMDIEKLFDMMRRDLKSWWD